MRRRPSLRSPFLVTVTTVAALSTACGAKVEETGGSNPKPEPSCPTSRPDVASACSSTLTCFYGPVDPCGNQSGLSCRDGKWEASFVSSCNPPPPECPKEVPVVGAACNAYGWGGCSYADPCVAGGYLSFMCSGGTWAHSGTPSVAACPTIKPTSGTSCGACAGRYPEKGCEYPTAYCPGIPATAVCDAKTGTWSVAEVACNPPPPDVDAGTFDGGA